MDVIFRRAESGRDQPVVQALIELYLHDMAEWFQFDINPDGTYGYDMTEHWALGEPVYLAEVDGLPAGFALVGTHPDVEDRPAGTIEIEEFFVVRQHRHSGLAENLARHVFDTWQGNWLVRVFNRNAPAVPFWRRVVNSYTNGNCLADAVTSNENPWTYYHFGPDIQAS